jgi:tetratricopeptide (TPR) repeat protein
MQFSDLSAIVKLREACQTAKIEVADLRRFLEDTASLREQGLDPTEVGAALAVAEQLETAGVSFDQAKRVAELLEALEEAGIDPRILDQLQEALERYRALGYSAEHITQLTTLAATMATLGVSVEDAEQWVRLNQRLRELGLDDEKAEGLATALAQAGVTGDQCGDVLAQVVQTAAVQVDIAKLKAERDALREDIAHLQADRAEYQESLNTFKEAVAHAAREESEVTTRLTAVRKQAAQWEDRLVAAEAFERFVLGNLELTDSFVRTLDALVGSRRSHAGQHPRVEQWLTKTLQADVKKFLMRIAAMAPSA